MKTIRLSLLAIAASFAVLSSCTKSDLTPAAANTTTNASLNTTASGMGGDCGMHCTCTQAQFGAGRGHDLLDHYFKLQFPNGFPIGSRNCGNGHIVWVKDASAVTTYLPMFGKPTALTQDYTSGTLPNNSLVGELITLCCNMDLEHYDPWFHDGMTTPLRDMKIGSGTFQGMTVDQFFKLANDVVGGCNTTYTAAQVDEVARTINENYTMHGKMMMDNGYLMCP